MKRLRGRSLLTGILVLAVLLIAWRGKVSAANIGPLLDSCPQFDPAYAQIRSDFEIRRNGVPVGDVFCAEPVSQLPITQYTDELIVLQGLRAVFYMDLGSNHQPWAPGTLYEWMKSKMAGIDISDTSGGSACCEMLDGKLFFILQAQDDFNRDFDRGWSGISGNIALYAHELRHVDGFPHVSCCGIPGGCDQTYDETNLSPYGIQWWLNAHWLTGDLYVGFSCLDPSQVADIAAWHLSATGVFRDRFCDNKPPLLTEPAMPGGECRPTTCILDIDQNGRAEVATDVVYIARTLLGLTPVPPSFRAIDASIPPDSTIAAGVNAAGTAVDVDMNGRVEVATDVVYIARTLLGLTPVPPSFRVIDPSIPPDGAIAGNVAALCP